MKIGWEWNLNPLREHELLTVLSILLAADRLRHAGTKEQGTTTDSELKFHSHSHRVDLTSFFKMSYLLLLIIAACILLPVSAFSLVRLTSKVAPNLTSSRHSQKVNTPHLYQSRALRNMKLSAMINSGDSSNGEDLPRKCTICSCPIAQMFSQCSSAGDRLVPSVHSAFIIYFILILFLIAFWINLLKR